MEHETRRLFGSATNYSSLLNCTASQQAKPIHILLRRERGLLVRTDDFLVLADATGRRFIDEVLKLQALNPKH